MTSARLEEKRRGGAAARDAHDRGAVGLQAEQAEQIDAKHVQVRHRASGRFLARGFRRLLGREPIDHEPVRAIGAGRHVRFPREPIGLGLARMIVHERFERIFLLRPPHRVVHAERLLVVDEVHAVLLHVLDVGLDDIGRIERISGAIHHEPGLVQKILGEQLSLDFHRRVLEDRQRAIQREERRKGRRIPHREIEIRGGPVRHSGEHDVVFVHVVGALHRIENRAHVFNLRVAPPRGVLPGNGQDVESAPRRRADRWTRCRESLHRRGL